MAKQKNKGQQTTIILLAAILIITALYLISSPKETPTQTNPQIKPETDNPHQTTPKAEEKTLCSDCNVVLISIDALRADHLGTYGYQRNTSPRIDELAQKSTVFEQAVTAWPKTVPALGSILTGNYGHTLRMMYGTFDPMLNSSTLISEILQEKGYNTGGFTSNGNLLIHKGWAQGFDDYVEVWKTDGYTKPDNINKHALNFLNKSKENKFFMWLHYIDPHAPYMAREREFRYQFINDSLYDSLFYDKDQKRDVDLQFAPNYTWRTAGINGIPQGVNEKNITKVAYYIAEYDAETKYTDKYVGAIIDYLQENDLLQKTIVIITADHGEALGDHDWYFDHGRFIYDDCSHVPLIMYVPQLEPGRVKHPVSSNDITPTILEALGIKEEHPMDGTSLMPVLKKEKGYVREYVFNEAGYNRDYQRSVRDGKWKLIYIPAPEAREVMQKSLFELYDLEQDPLETNNLATEKPEEVARLKNILFDWMSQTMPPLQEYELRENISRAYTADYDFINQRTSQNNFYAKIVSSNRDLDYCFTLPIPNPNANIIIELLESNSLQKPYEHENEVYWDDPQIDKDCIGDPWGCLKVNDQVINQLPYTIKLGELGQDIDTTYVSLHGQDNNKTFCFKTGEFNKRLAESNLGYYVEIKGVVEEGEDDRFADVDEITRQNLESLGYIN